MSRKAKLAPVKSRDEIYAALVESRQLKSAFDLALATEITDALVAGNLAEVTRALSLLPPVVQRVGRTGKTVTAEQAKDKLWQAYLDNRAAYEHDVASGRAEPDNTGIKTDDQHRDDDAEVADLRRQVESLQDEILHLRGTRPRRLPPPSDKPIVPTRKPAPAPDSARKSATPTPAPPPGQASLYRPSERAWSSWYYSGGGGGGESLGSFFSRINGREY